MSLCLNLGEPLRDTDRRLPTLQSLQMVVRLVESICMTWDTRSRRSSGPLCLSLKAPGFLQQARMVSLSSLDMVWSSSRADSMRRWMEASMGLLSGKSADWSRRGNFLKSLRYFRCRENSGTRSGAGSTIARHTHSDRLAPPSGPSPPHLSSRSSVLDRPRLRNFKLPGSMNSMEPWVTQLATADYRSTSLEYTR